MGGPMTRKIVEAMEDTMERELWAAYNQGWRDAVNRRGPVSWTVELLQEAADRATGYVAEMKRR